MLRHSQAFASLVGSALGNGFGDCVMVVRIVLAGYLSKGVTEKLNSERVRTDVGVGSFAVIRSVLLSQSVGHGSIVQ